MTLVITSGACSLGSWRGSNDNAPSFWLTGGSVASFEARGGNAILLTRGIRRGTNGLGLSNFPFTNWVEVKDADAAHPSALLSYRIGNNSSFLRLINLDTSGGVDNVSAPVNRFNITNSHEIHLDRSS
ncbi:MAG: hypothetical protein GC203_02725 [Phenylobacterium sp.]|uniref:hypothetical protein n=1 Tax=Phenylobacterium sp. TaxID=1871053 RepID=UPI0025EDD11F|nr:hypothetical protein [Phenylobacterium sp.]MBI1196755.1 hypothetical protein [Phenylobacterium sp.]